MQKKGKNKEKKTKQVEYFSIGGKQTDRKHMYNVLMKKFFKKNYVNNGTAKRLYTA